MEQLCSHWTDFREILIFEYFAVSYWEHSRLIKTRVLYMKTFVNLWYELSEFFLEWEIFRTKLVQKIKTHLIFYNSPLPKSYCLYDNVVEYGRAGQATKDNIIWRMRFACWITKATDSHLKYLVLLLDFPRQHWLRERISVLRYTRITCLV